MAAASRRFARAALVAALWIDARRPASWIALVAAAISGWALAADDDRPFRVAVAIASGGLLALAAIGRLPTGVPGGERGPWAALAWLRAGWAAAGFLGGAVAAVLAGAGVAAAAAPVMAATSAVAAAAVVACSPGGPRTSAVAASLALTTVGVAAAAAGAAALGRVGLLVECLAAAAAWGLFVASLAFDRGAAARDWLGGTAAMHRHRAAEPGLGVPMATTLVAMATCFFLAPQFARLYTLLALGWLVCLTAPLLTATGNAAAERRLARAAVGRPLLPGGIPRLATGIGQVAAVLAWPALVAAVLAAVRVWQGRGPVLALVGLAAGASVMLFAAGLAGRRRETARAVVLALAAAVAVFASGASRG